MRTSEPPSERRLPSERWQPPPGLPPRIRSDASNAFAHHTMSVRVPAILSDVLRDNADYSPDVRARIEALAQALREGALLPEPAAGTPHAAEWHAELASRAGEGWLSSDWFGVESYVYRCLADASGFWSTGRDPFAPTKRAEYASAGHLAALEAAVAIDDRGERAIERLLLAALFGNRMDLSFAAARERGVLADEADLLVDDRAAARAALERGSGPVHFIIDNAGTELSIDLVLATRLLERGVDVVLHVRVHPAFVSDALERDVRWFIEGDDEPAVALWAACSPAARACRERLSAALADGRLRVAAHAVWNGPASLWQLPAPLGHELEAARLVILKGDAHYRRAVGDALWAPDTPFARVTGYFPAPLLALRTLKSDSIVGLAPGVAERLDAEDARWRVNGRRGVASLGGLPLRS